MPVGEYICKWHSSIKAVSLGRCFVVVATFCIFVARGYALDPTTPLRNYGRQGWNFENGLPQNTVQALAQSADGFLWIGTEAGLVRFDGVRFVVFDKNSTPAFPGNDIQSLVTTPDGALWIVTNAGTFRWQGGVLAAVKSEDNIPKDVAVKLANRSEHQNPTATLIGDYAVVTTNSVVEIARAKPNSSRASNAVARLAIGKDLPAGVKITVLLADREGALWIGTSAGLVRWVKGTVDRFPVVDLLATRTVLSLSEDREGDLWVGTEADGLQVLRDRLFTEVSSQQGLPSDHISTVMEGERGSMWVGTQDEGLVSIARDATGDWHAFRALNVLKGLSSNVILSMAAAANGDLWVGTPDGLNRISGSRVQVFTSADGLPDDLIRSLYTDADGSLWIGTRRGLTHWFAQKGELKGKPDAAHTETFTHLNGLGSDLLGAITRDNKGDLWVATLAGLSRLHHGAIENFTTANGLPDNIVTALLPLPDGMLLAGTQSHGWSLWNSREFSPVMVGGQKDSIHAILDDQLGHLWFATSGGIARCDRSKNEDAQSICTNWMEYGTADGLPSRETATNSHPAAWRSSDGLLWFATPRGLVEVDPAHFPANALPPPVVLEGFQVDDVAQPLTRDGSTIKISPGRAHFEFDYAGLSLMAPNRVSYRFMLEGFDRGWTQAGGRRAAYYTNIPPGHYTFRVQATNNNGVWNTEGAALQFDLQPHYYQTAWFKVLMLAAAVILIAAVWRQRLRQSEKEFRAVLAERTRIAREIHDTLAQGYVGVSVQLEVLSELLRKCKEAEAMSQLNKIREYVREGLSDARQSIWGLRTQDTTENTLPVRLRRIADAANEDNLSASFSLHGAYRVLDPKTESEMLRIAQEAINNVKRHSGANTVQIQLEYRLNEVELIVQDNGKGVASDSSSGPSSGHFGIAGMRERATEIQGTLRVESVAGMGTTVRLSVPAATLREEAKQS